MNRPEVRIQFAILGQKEFDIGKPSALAGIVPDKEWRIGDVIAKTKLKRKDNGWVLESDTVKSWDAGALAEEFFFRRVLDAKEVITEAQRDTKFETVELRIRITASAGLPAVYLSNKLLFDAQIIGAAIDVDVVMA